jgi:acetyl esterase/lipase
MASSSITTVEKLSLLPHVVVGLSVGFLRLATRPFTNDVKPITAYKDFVYAVFRYVLANVTIAQEKWLAPPTETMYLNFAQERKFKPDSTVLSSGLRIHWIGDKTADKVFLYFHGGGYVNAISAQHLEWLLELQTDLSKKENVAVAVVGYTCAPEGQYPVQLRQGVESLVWLLSVGGKKPENVSYVPKLKDYDIVADFHVQVFIGGDSAGGNLALAILSHILHPHPKFGDELRVKLSAPLAGAVLTSPWVKFPTDDPSAKRNAGSDFVCVPAAHRWAVAFNGM